MEYEGWVKLFRKVQNNFLWSEKPFDKFHAWSYMILNANHSDHDFTFNGEVIHIKSGSFITSEYKLSEEWGWDRGKVRSFLKMLEEQHMIRKTSDKRKTIIYIIKYDDYQKEKPKKTKQEYKPKEPKNSNKHTYKKATNKFNDFPQREYKQEDYEEMERKFMDMGYKEGGRKK